MHLRPPSLSRGFTAFLWGLGLGLFLWIFLVSVGFSGGTSFLLGLLAGLGIFFYVRICGGERYRS